MHDANSTRILGSLFLSRISQFVRRIDSRLTRLKVSRDERRRVSEMPREAKAWHESGHALARLLLGLEFEHVTLGDADGRPRVFTGGCDDLFTPERMRKDLCVVLAGGLAQSAQARTLQGPIDSDWMNRVWDVECDEDLARALETAHAIHEDEGISIDEILGSALLVTFEMFSNERNLGILASIAASLLERGVLTLQEVRTLVTAPPG